MGTQLSGSATSWMVVYTRPVVPSSCKRQVRNESSPVQRFCVGLRVHSKRKSQHKADTIGGVPHSSGILLIPPLSQPTLQNSTRTGQRTKTWCVKQQRKRKNRTAMDQTLNTVQICGIRARISNTMELACRYARMSTGAYKDMKVPSPEKLLTTTAHTQRVPTVHQVSSTRRAHDDHQQIRGEGEQQTQQSAARPRESWIAWKKGRSAAR